MDAFSLNARQSAILWLAGFREACSLHRVFIFCFSSKALAIRTGQCFMLNGLIFLGSLFMFNSVVIPTLLWILPSECGQFGSEHLCQSGTALALYSFTRHVLVELFYLFWFYPLYGFSIILSNMWYNNIARHAFEVLKSKGLHLAKVPAERSSSDNQNGMYSSRPSGLEGFQVVAALLIPYIGTGISCLLNAWMYAYYCFEYKWNLSELSLDRRLEFFETNWAFFAGFGSPCVLAVCFFSRLVSYGVMAMLFPLFVLTAAGSQAEQVIDFIRRDWSGGGPGKFPIFYAADTLSMLVLRFFPNVRRDSDQFS
ncbi:protein EI24 homolog isoform X2 [Phalaenopsis equestris]|uniref:protein EI24 homolog isoform X2 n=1 Tax=Phalaenopsis equestris TaxID=78828 RepID=UPI0009E55B24|nr:protein EI24 homolog isoform X2 [Phalaenopsis equestris]